MVLDKDARESKRIQDEKEAALEERRASMVKRCDKKIARRRSQAEQREAILAEELSRTRAVVKAKREEIEVADNLAAKLSRRKNEEVKRALKSDIVKSSARLPSSCAVDEARSRMIEEKVRLEANQAELLKLWHEDKIIDKLQRAENERKKQNLRDELQNQLADNQRRVQREISAEKEQDRKMMERAIRKIQEKDAKIKEKREDAIILNAEMTASLAAKNAWEKKYKNALKDEDKKIARVIAEKEARQKKQLGMEIELRAARDVAIEKVMKKLLVNVCKEKKRQEIADELYREEQRSKWKKESIRPAKKQCVIAESFQEIARRKAERKARDEVDNAAFKRYLTEEWKKDLEKQREDNNARQAKKIQYGKELKEIITNNRIKYAMNILERKILQSENCAHDKKENQLTDNKYKIV